MRIGIAGAGIAGLTLAWLLDGVHESVVLEARDDLGGNLRSQRFIDTHGTPRMVDLGVHSVSLEAFPLFSRLTNALGLSEDDWVSAPASHTIEVAEQEAPFFQGPLTASVGDEEAEGDGLPPRDAGQAVTTLVRESAKWAARGLDWQVPLRDMVEPWPWPTALKENVVYALPAILWGCDLARASTLSARAVAALFADGAPAGSTPLTQTLRHGMQDVAWRLAAQLNSADLRPGTALRGIRRAGDRLAMIDATGVPHEVDAVVLAVPADAAARALQDLPDAEPARRALASYRYADIDQGLHLDPCYVARALRHRSTTNIAVDGSWALGCIRRRFEASGEVYVSQLDHRANLPRQLLARTTFRTLLPFPAMFAAQRRLGPLQGRGGLHFAGHVVAQGATQEAAVATAVDTARRLGCDSPRLKTLAPS
ncbi:FAD-dependent oxidoreductase [Streptomyces sp. Edi4]|uniref:FAD-dependent oxidoreductase n=1 Tax=Streptomyces sp. Edi4 TaxID=3162527 RepID=UPI0033061207